MNDHAATTPADRRRPMPGDLVRIVDTHFVIAKVGTMGVIDGTIGKFPEDDLGRITFNATYAFRGPVNASDPGPGYVSVVGGPVAQDVHLLDLLPTGEEVDMRVWRWKDYPRADGRQEYTVRVPIWEWNPANAKENRR